MHLRWDRTKDAKQRAPFPFAGTAIEKMPTVFEWRVDGALRYANYHVAKIRESVSQADIILQLCCIIKKFIAGSSPSHERVGVIRVGFGARRQLCR
jgi:hypothetical protein